MIATQSLKLYEIVQRHFKNDADAKFFVHEIEEIVDNKFEKEKTQLATKEDIYLIRQDISKVQTEFEKRFNTIILWVVSTGIAVVALIFASIKLFIAK